MLRLSAGYVNPHGWAPSLAPAAPFAGANFHRHSPCSFVVRGKEQQAVKRRQSRAALPQCALDNSQVQPGPQLHRVVAEDRVP